jgi:enamine deaminase RidA (YjgF/YER057c/UK114 family)
MTILFFSKNGLKTVARGDFFNNVKLFMTNNNKQIDFELIEWNDIYAAARLSKFCPTNAVAEYHAMIQLNNTHVKAEEQFRNIEAAIARVKNSLGDNMNCVFKRYFVSDAVNQRDFLHRNDNTAVSIVEQAPLNGNKVSVWAYFVQDCSVYEDSGTYIMKRSAYKHLYNTQLHTPLTDEEAEIRSIFESYVTNLAEHNCTLKDNCIRTWIYVQGVDIHYAEMVKERRRFFEKEGLTSETHFIASTGIEGRYTNPKSLTLMDAYAVAGIKTAQVKYIQATTHLNPTCEYGVTFERATSVDYGDRRHVFISGTASINNKGEIMYPSDILKQTERTFENISVLLKQAETQMSNVVQMIIYLRDIADYNVVAEYVTENYATTPYVIVLAPVCRPGWLVEVECIAIKAIENSKFERF